MSIAVGEKTHAVTQRAYIFPRQYLVVACSWLKMPGLKNVPSPALVSPNQLVFGCTSPSSAVLQGSFSAQYWPWAFVHRAQLSHDLPIMLLSKRKTLLGTGWVIVMLTSSLLLKCKPSRIAALQLQFPNKQSSFYTLRL